MADKHFSDYISEYLSSKESERQQASVRLLFAVFLCIFAYGMHFGSRFGDAAIYFTYVASLFLVFSIALLVFTSRYSSYKLLSRKMGITLDISFITTSLVIGGPLTAFIYGGYLWVSIANGLRFGVRYLRVAQLASLVSFSLVLMFSHYWHENMVLGIGLWLWLLLLPVYVSKLLHILEDAVQAATDANKAKSTFLANMSHEIRTPLTAIIGYAEVSLDSKQTMQERSKALKTIVRSGNHLLNIINEILDFSKVEAGKLEVETRPVALFQLLTDTEALIKQNAEGKGLAFNIEYSFPLPATLMTDSVRLKQILLNLCSNAIKFTDNGAVILSVSYDKENALMQFSVKDTGIGLTETQIQKLFKPFQQANSSITRRFGGTGLGLSLSMRLAERLGGTINVTSKPGEGSCFSLMMPMDALHEVEYIANAEQIPVSVDSDSDISDTQVLSGHILLAEDNTVNQELLSLFLQKMGAEVSVAGNGKIAAEMARKNKYDLVYMDMQMPVMSGIEAVKILRESGYQQPVVALTANTMKEDRDACLNAGCDDFLTKPVLQNILYEMTARYLQAVSQPDRVCKPITSTLLSEEPELRDLVENFVSELPGMIAELQHMCQQKDWEPLKDLLHNIKGIGGGYGYDVLTSIAGKAEFQLLSENYKAVHLLLQDMVSVSECIYEGMRLDKAATTDHKINQLK